MPPENDNDHSPLESSSQRSGLARAMELASITTTIALEMAFPPLGGYWLDQWLQTNGLFVILGAALGFISGMWSLIRLAGRLGGQPRDGQGRKNKPGDSP